MRLYDRWQRRECRFGSGACKNVTSGRVKGQGVWTRKGSSVHFGLTATKTTVCCGFLHSAPEPVASPPVGECARFSGSEHSWQRIAGAAADGVARGAFWGQKRVGFSE